MTEQASIPGASRREQEGGKVLFHADGSAPVFPADPIRRWEGIGSVAVFACAAMLPLAADPYFAVVGTRAAIYWILIGGLALVVGYAGQLAIGYVGLLAIGAYATSALTAGTLGFTVPVVPALLLAMGGGALCGVCIGLPGLRLTTFYFAMSTLGFAMIVNQIALAWSSVTGGGVGVPAPVLPAPFDSEWGLYTACLVIAAFVTWIVFNLAHSRYGRSLMALRDIQVVAEISSISKPRLLLLTFLLSGGLAGLSGGLFSILQTYITPEAFTIDLSLLFFIAVLIGGQSSILGPLLATVLLTILPEFTASLVTWSSFSYAVLLLVVVLLAPGGFAQLLHLGRRTKRNFSRPAVSKHPPAVATAMAPKAALSLRQVSIQFGGLKAVTDLNLTLAPSRIHGLIGPNGSGKTTTLNLITGFYRPSQGEILFGERRITDWQVSERARLGIARTFQTPRIVGDISVLENVAIGASRAGVSDVVGTMLGLPRNRRDERLIKSMAYAALADLGLADRANERADRLPHTDLRMVEIARAMCLQPAYLLLDEPAAGLSGHEIERLAELIRTIRSRGTAVLLVEHHTELVFDICDHVTVLNLGSTLAEGAADSMRANAEVANVYLGR
jgi:ABC-type branched-subunit amino acid transport system ATPase component/ABC-type branched-subunit amino acid transport system permease subunit